MATILAMVNVPFRDKLVYINCIYGYTYMLMKQVDQYRRGEEHNKAIRTAKPLHLH